MSVAAPPDDSLLRFVAEPEPVDVKAGEGTRLTVGVATDAYADLAVEAHLISPWGTWEWMGPPHRVSNCRRAERLNSASTSRRRSGWNPANGGR